MSAVTIVSEIGSTWLSSLIDMEAMRPLTSRNLDLLRAQERFFPAARLDLFNTPGKGGLS